MDLFLDFFKNSFMHIRPVLQILILTVLIYYCLYYIRGTRGANILAGFVIILILLTTLADRLKFDVISVR